jgi:hypothetical protein
MTSLYLQGHVEGHVQRSQGHILLCTFKIYKKNEYAYKAYMYYFDIILIHLLSRSRLRSRSKVTDICGGITRQGWAYCQRSEFYYIYLWLSGVPKEFFDLGQRCSKVMTIRKHFAFAKIFILPSTITMPVVTNCSIILIENLFRCVALFGVPSDLWPWGGSKF